MKQIRKPNEDLAGMISELKIGDAPIVDSVSGYEIVKVPGGYIYKNEYIGMVFVPGKTAAGGMSRTSRMLAVEK